MSLIFSPVCESIFPALPKYTKLSGHAQRKGTAMFTSNLKATSGSIPQAGNNDYAENMTWFPWVPTKKREKGEK